MPSEVVLRVGLYTGGTLDVYDSGAIDCARVTPETIAHGLSQVTRFGGQTVHPFSVAEHSVNMVALARASGYTASAILLHDAPECLGIGDTQRYVKRRFGSEQMRTFDHQLTLALWKHLCPGAEEWSYYERGVKNTDVTAGAIEAKFFGYPCESRDLPYWEKSEWPARPKMWAPGLAKQMWLASWYENDGRTADTYSRAGALGDGP